MVGLAVGLYIAITAIGNGYQFFAVAAPLAAFVVGGILWSRIVKDKFDSTKIIITGLLTGTISHYITFVLLSIGMNICYWTIGGCTGSLGEPPASILSMIGGAFAFSFFSLLFFGWITVPCSIIIGLTLRGVNKRKNLAQQ